MNQHAIGILDSGVGGLTVVKEVMRQLPQETIYYFGDTLRCPYGSRSHTEIRQFTLEIVDFLLQFPLKAIVIACNTATAAALQAVRERVNMPVLGVIEPGARAAIKATKEGKIAVIGTQATINSGAYERTLKRIHPRLTVYSLACPSFVPLVEEGKRFSEEAEREVFRTLKVLRGYKIDTLVLGCTHYPLLAHAIQKAMGEQVTLISSAEETAVELSAILYHQNLLATHPTQHRFFTTGDAEKFMKLAEEWMGERIWAETVALPSVSSHL